MGNCNANVTTKQIEVSFLNHVIMSKDVYKVLLCTALTRESV